MGASNRYTLIENKNVSAVYIDTSCNCWESDIYDCDCASNTVETLKNIIEELPLVQRYGWDDSRNACYYGEMYKIVLECGNHNEIIVNLEYQDDFEQYGLQEYNYEKTYHKIAKFINSQIAVEVGHGWTSSQYDISQYGK